MNALHTPIPCQPMAAATPAIAGAAPACAAGAAVRDAQVVEDRLRSLFRLSTRRGLIHPLHHVMLRFRKEALPPRAANEEQA